MLISSGRGKGWNGHHQGDDENYWEPIRDGKSSGVQPTKQAVSEGQYRNQSASDEVSAM